MSSTPTNDIMDETEKGDLPIALCFVRGTASYASSSLEMTTC
jgi:hypothetical protein